MLQSLSMTFNKPTPIGLAGTVTYTSPLVSVTWLPFCLTALNPNSLQRILMSFRPSIGASLAKLSSYCLDSLLPHSRQMEFQRFFEVPLRRR